MSSLHHSLVKLNNKAVTLVSEHKRTTLKHPLVRDWVLVHAHCQTDHGCALASHEDRLVHSLLDVLEEL